MLCPPSLCPCNYRERKGGISIHVLIRDSSEAQILRPTFSITSVHVAQWLERLTYRNLCSAIWSYVISFSVSPNTGIDQSELVWYTCYVIRHILIRWNALAPVLSSAVPGKWDEFLPIWETNLIFIHRISRYRMLFRVSQKYISTKWRIFKGNWTRPKTFCWKRKTVFCLFWNWQELVSSSQRNLLDTFLLLDNLCKNYWIIRFEQYR